jgi:hypothetical protein
MSREPRLEPVLAGQWQLPNGAVPQGFCKAHISSAGERAAKGRQQLMIQLIGGDVKA